MIDSVGVNIPCGDTSSFSRLPLTIQPEEVRQVINLIRNGGPFNSCDNRVFYNREGLLPKCEVGYYKEFTVKRLDEPGRGARRLVTGRNNEYFYTTDHYGSFVILDEHS